MFALFRVALTACAAAVLPLAAAQEAACFPPRGAWERRAPAAVGMDAQRLEEALRFAQASAASTPADLREFIATTLANEPHGEIVGPVRDRGPASGSSCGAGTSSPNGASPTGST
jgi:hypothetical protein